MAIFKQDMEEILMNAGCLYSLDPLFATHKGGELILMWQDAKATVDYYYDGLFSDYETLNEARFFVMADYLTYIPYGSCGYAAFEKMLKEVSPDISVGQYRYEWLKRCVGESLLWLNDGQLGYIKYFFENYNKKEINLKIPAETVSLICRYHHECEANFSRKGFTNLMQISDDHTYAFAHRFSSECSDCDTADSDKFLKELPPYGELGEEELKFIRKFTGLQKE